MKNIKKHSNLCFYDANYYAFFDIRDFDDLGTKAIMKESDAFACVLIYRINNISGG